MWPVGQHEIGNPRSGYAVTRPPFDHRSVGATHAWPMSGKPRESWSYSGEAWTDGEGRAVVQLPAFTRAHRAGFEYELTPVGSRSSATVAKEIADGRSRSQPTSPT